MAPSPTSCPGSSQLLVHFCFMSFSSRLGFSPPEHLSPGIFRYLEVTPVTLVTPQPHPAQDLAPLREGFPGGLRGFAPPQRYPLVLSSSRVPWRQNSRSWPFSSGCSTHTDWFSGR